MFILLTCLLAGIIASDAFSPVASGKDHGWGVGEVPKSGFMQGSAIGVTSAYLESCAIVSGAGLSTGRCGTTDFWGRPRREQEIIDFVAQAVFGDDPEGGRQRIKVLHAEPPLIAIQGFLSNSMCDEIINSAIQSGELTRSKVGTDLSTSNIRTSSTVWLQEDQCEAPSRIFSHLASRLSGLPPTNQENLQVVHYGPGQKFDIHTDHLNEFNDYGMSRLATCLLYLNTAESDAKEMRFDIPKTGLSGGETWFPEFDAKVKPERGTVIFWWNTLERPGSDGYTSDMYLNVDVRSRHAGLPVLSGDKWVANKWIHPVDIGRGVRGY